MLRIIIACLMIIVAGPAAAKDACTPEDTGYFVPGSAWISADSDITKAMKEIAAKARISPVVCEYSPIDVPMPFMRGDVVYFPAPLKAKLTYEELRALLAHETAHVIRGPNHAWHPDDSAYLREEIATDLLAARWVGKAGLISMLLKSKHLKEFEIRPKGIALIDKRLNALIKSR